MWIQYSYSIPNIYRIVSGMTRISIPFSRSRSGFGAFCLRSSSSPTMYRNQHVKLLFCASTTRDRPVDLSAMLNATPLAVGSRAGGEQRRQVSRSVL